VSPGRRAVIWQTAQMTESRRPICTVDLADPELFRSGFPHVDFTRLRRETPISWLPLDGIDLGVAGDDGCWILTKHADVQAANRDAERFSAYDGPSIAVVPGFPGNMLVSLDGADHTRLRRLVSAGFTPRMIALLEERARGWATSILDRALEQQRCEFVNEVAYQLPMHMIADIVGIPVADREWLFTLTNKFLQGSDDITTPEEQFAVQFEMFEYAQALGREKRSNPADDVWTTLTTVEIETERGEHTRLTEIELDMFFLLLTVAGSETTRSAIAGGIHALIEHPDQLTLLRSIVAANEGVQSPALRVAVDEILRWTSPVAYFARRATADVKVGDLTIPAGERVTLWYPSANRDDDEFERPFEFDLTRTPNHHVSFGGGGPHFCLGANLAKMEIALFFDEFCRRVASVEALAAPVYTPLSLMNPITLAMTEFSVALTAA
jgi:cytochrome P450